MDVIRLRNYRCFEDTGWIDLKPINILLGANSSGKSSFIKFFPLLKQSMGLKRNGVFLWYGTDVDFKNFENVVKDGYDTMVIEFIIKNFSYENIVNPPRTGRRTNVVVTLELAKSDKLEEFMKTLLIRFDDQEILIELNPNRSIAKVRVNGNSTDEDFDKLFAMNTTSLLPRFMFVKKQQANEEFPSWCIEKLRPIFGDARFSQYRKVFKSLVLGNVDDVLGYLYAQSPESKGVHRMWLNNTYILLHLNTLIDAININLIRLAKSVSYVGPLRATAQRYYRYQNYAVEEIDSDGKNLAMYLYNLEPDAEEHFQEWTQRLFNFKLEVHPIEGSVELMVSEKGQPARNMVDLGFGYTQLLPILAIVWKALYKDAHPHNTRLQTERDEHIIAIEQPELHLHPRLQGLFATMLSIAIADAKNNGCDLRFVIETHSEIIMNKLGELIALGNLNRNDVSIQLFNAQKEGLEKYVESVGFTEEGQLTNWPFGFFSDYDFES